MELQLNGKELANQQLLHEAIARQLHLPDYYGENLDALWDILSCWNEPLAIIIEHPTRFVEQLGGYGESVLQLLQDAEEENSMISVEYRE